KLKNRRHPGWLTRVAERLHGRGTVAAKRSADRAMGVAWRGPHARAGAKDRNAPCSDGGAASIGAPNNFTQGAHCASAIGVPISSSKTDDIRDGLPEWLSVSTGGGRLLLSDQRTARWVLLGEDHMRELERRIETLRVPTVAPPRLEPPTISLKGLTVHLQSAFRSQAQKQTTSGMAYPSG